MVRKVASAAGVKRYKLPKGTPLDGSHGGRTAKNVLARISTKVPTKPAPDPTKPTMAKDKNGKMQKMVPSQDYGMTYDPKGEKEVERARKIPKDLWDKLPTQTVKHGTPVIANEAHLKERSINKVVGGSEPFREGYVGQMWKDKDGNLHMADGHTRFAMYNALGKDMPAKIMSESDLKSMQERTERREIVKAARDKNHRRKLVRENADRARTERVVSKADKEKAAMNIQDHEPEPSAEARAVAKKIQGKAKAAEKTITHDVVTAAARNNANMERLGFRLKEEKSFALKMDRNMHAKKHPDTGEFTTTPEDEADLIRDAVRYTATVPTKTYWTGGDKIIAELVAKGHVVTKDKGGDGKWPKRKYRGRNVQLKSPDGVYWELQVHTKESLAVAEKNHGYYNEWRHQDTPVARVQELDVLMGDLFEGIPVPPNTVLVDERPGGAN